MSGQTAHKRLLRWDIWWRWALASLVGITVASLLYRALPDALVNPLDDEDIWLIQPWRVAALTCVYFTPISLAQWLVLRRYLPRAWWWLVVTLGSVVVLYPGSIWALWNLHQWDLASAVWFLGVEGGSVYIAAQWVALWRWTHNPRIWLWCVATSLGWLCALIVNALLNADLVLRISAGGLGGQVQAIALSSLYQLTFGGVLAAVLLPDSQGEVT